MRSLLSSLSQELMESMYGVGEGGQTKQGAGEEPLVLPVPGAALPDKRRRREIQHTGKLHENISK